HEVPRLLSARVDFKRMVILLDDKNVKRYLSRISSGELASLLSIASVTASEDTLALRDDSENNDWRVLQRKLRDVRNVHPVDGFDVRAFIEGMMFGYPSRDEFGDHYSVTSGEAQEDYRLYVNPTFQGGPANCMIVASFKYAKDSCLLLKEV